MNIEDVAKCCYEANRVLCTACGNFSLKPWPEAKDWQRDFVERRVEYCIWNPDAPDSDFHDIWCAKKRAAGWVLGPVKDAEAKTHPCLVPFDFLPHEQQAKDALFKAICRALIPLIGLHNPELTFSSE